MPDQLNLDEQRELVAQACRVLAHRELVEGHLGHVSMRCGEGMLLRCRGPRERGLQLTEPDDIKLIGLDGQPLEDVGKHRMPTEWPIHGELLRRRTDMNAVVHAHPPAALISGLAELELRPVFGAFNIPATQIAAAGVPVYGRAVLIRTPELAGELDTAMGDRPLCIMRGHGVTVTGVSIADAMVRAVNLDVLTKITWELARLGVKPPTIPESDLAEFPELPPRYYETEWRLLVAAAGAERRGQRHNSA